MGKINKYANIYDKDGNLLRHVGEDGKLKNYTTEELEALVDKLAEDKDEEGHVKDPIAYRNVNSMLFQYYQKYGNPHETELIKKLQEVQKQKASGEVTMVEKTTSEEVENALKDVDTEELVDRETTYEPDTYVDFEEIADSDETKEVA